MTVNTLISGNIPSSFSTFLRSAESVTTTDTEEYERISDKELTLQVPGEFVVDNEDPGFHYVSVSHESKLKQYIDSRKEENTDVFYGEVRSSWYRPKWTPVVHSAFYGESVRSAIITIKGEGENTARWTAILPAAGFYDVYVYIPMSAMFDAQGGRFMGGGGGGQGRPPAGGGEPGQMGHGRGMSFPDRNTVYNYIISSNEGSEEVEFPLRNVEEGWNRVGAFHFPGDTAIIELSNKTNGRRVIADAVKWVIR